MIAPCRFTPDTCFKPNIALSSPKELFLTFNNPENSFKKTFRLPFTSLMIIVKGGSQ
jgi:hypothetical protein